MVFELGVLGKFQIEMLQIEINADIMKETKLIEGKRERKTEIWGDMRSV
jgi:hypothetical protein